MNADNKKRILLAPIALVLLLCFVSAFLTSCGVKLEARNSKIYNTKTHKSYVLTPTYYEPKTISKEAYATLKYNDTETDFFEIGGYSPEEWLANEFGDVYCATGETLPGLDGFGATGALVCENNDASVMIAEITDTEALNKAIDIFTEEYDRDTDGIKPDLTDGYTVLEIKFTSEKYPNLYFALKLAVSSEGAYLYSSSDRVYAYIGDIFASYISEAT